MAINTEQQIQLYKGLASLSWSLVRFYSLYFIFHKSLLEMICFWTHARCRKLPCVFCPEKLLTEVDDWNVLTTVYFFIQFLKQAVKRQSLRSSILLVLEVQPCQCTTLMKYVWITCSLCMYLGKFKCQSLHVMGYMHLGLKYLFLCVLFFCVFNCKQLTLIC